MKLTQTQESIVPKQSVTDLWPQMQRKECVHSLMKQEPVLQNADEAKFYAAYLDATRYAP